MIMALTIHLPLAAFAGECENPIGKSFLYGGHCNQDVIWIDFIAAPPPPGSPWSPACLASGMVIIDSSVDGWNEYPYRWDSSTCTATVYYQSDIYRPFMWLTIDNARLIINYVPVFREVR